MLWKIEFGPVDAPDAILFFETETNSLAELESVMANDRSVVLTEPHRITALSERARGEAIDRARFNLCGVMKEIDIQLEWLRNLQDWPKGTKEEVAKYMKAINE